MGLPSKHRLKRRLIFQSVYQQGIRLSSLYFIIRALPVDESASSHPVYTQIGISVSRKVSKKAVIRNRIKRHIRIAFRSLLPQISSPWYIVIVVKPEVKECNYEHFLRELEKLLIKANIINGY